MNAPEGPQGHGAEDRLAQRLCAALEALSMTAPAAAGSGELLHRLVLAARQDPSARTTWLLMVALSGVLPLEDEIRAATRRLRVHPGARSELDLLDIASEAAGRTPGDTGVLTVVRDQVLVDVDYCARHSTHTGIQRVVRETLPLWRARHALVPVAWTDGRTMLRTLRPDEARNVFDYSTEESDCDRSTDSQTWVETVSPLVVPWRSVLVLPEIADPEAGPALAALAQFSGNTVGAIGYDMIPIVSADQRPGPEATRFTQYLNMIKHADRVAAISRSSQAEFRGFAAALAAQGLPGPQVEEIVLPAAVPDSTTREPPPTPRPVVLCVGTHDPHKNHRALVHAAELLWREGLNFELVFIGGDGWRFDSDGACLAGAVDAGRPARNLGRVSDADLTRMLRTAAFTVFVSLHEGFGLPVTESLAAGTPAIVSNFGSLAEIAEDGGCLTVDPRDDASIASGMRRLLTEPALAAELRAQISRRPQRTWHDYSAQLWDFLVGVEPLEGIR